VRAGPESGATLRFTQPEAHGEKFVEADDSKTVVIRKGDQQVSIRVEFG
jgi:hypothetical protein